VVPVLLPVSVLVALVPVLEAPVPVVLSLLADVEVLEVVVVEPEAR